MGLYFGVVTVMIAGFPIIQYSINVIFIFLYIFFKLFQINKSKKIINMLH